MDICSPDIWNDIIAQALVVGEVTIPKWNSDGDEIPAPSESGLFRKSVGEPKGQIADWRASISGSQRGVHVVEFEDRYSVHVDNFDPAKQPLKHIIHDSPGTGIAIALIGIGASAAVRALLGRRRRR